MNRYEKTKENTLKDIKEGKRISPLKAIRNKCLDCSCFDGVEVANCPIEECPLWAFRSGKNLTGKDA
jgi:hypothetical protein